MRTSTIRLAWIVAVSALLLAATARPAQAQTPVPRPPSPGTPAPLEPGDVLWTFAPEPPLSDDRIAAAIGTLMAPILDAIGPAGTRIVRVTARGPGFEPGFVAPAGEVPLLFRAAGFPEPSALREVGQCKVWAAPPPVGTSPTTPPAAFEARPQLIAALEKALGSLGIRARSCVATDNVAEAHVLIWQHGGAAPVLAQRNEPTFLWSQGDVGPLTPRQPGGTAGGSAAPRPPVTGNAGLQSEASNSALRAAALFAAVVFVVAARMLTQRGRGGA